MTKPSPTIAAQDETRHELEMLLERYIGLHERILELTREHRAALSSADGRAIASCLTRQHEIWAEVRELDRERGRLAMRMQPGPSAPGTQPTLSDLAKRLPDPSRRRALALAAHLKDLLTSIQRQSGVVQSATRTLLAHMDGVMQQVVRTVNRARVYTTRGTLAAGGPVVCGVDLVR